MALIAAGVFLQAHHFQRVIINYVSEELQTSMKLVSLFSVFKIASNHKQIQYVFVHSWEVDGE